MMRAYIATLVLALVTFHAVAANHTMVGYLLDFEHRIIQIENDLRNCKTNQEGTF